MAKLLCVLFFYKKMRAVSRSCPQLQHHLASGKITLFSLLLIIRPQLSSKLFKSSKDQSGTVSNAWHFVAEDMEATASTHRCFPLNYI